MHDLVTHDQDPHEEKVMLQVHRDNRAKIQEVQGTRSEYLVEGILPNDGVKHYLPEVKGTSYRINASYILLIIMKIETAYFKAVT